MSCPDLGPLLARRLSARGGEEPRLLEHLEACADCRRRALEADPSLLFRGLRPEPARPGEIEEVKRTVHALRRLDGFRELPRRRPSGGHVAAAAGLALVLLLAMHAGTGRRERESGGERAAAAVSNLPAALPTAADRGGPLLDEPALIEELSRPGARVYQLGDEELSVVMIVDESLDV